jgi:anti-sigma factor RsiW
MDHTTAQSHFSDYLEGELSAEERRDLEKHLEGCNECKTELQDFKTTVHSLSGLYKLPVPDDFGNRVERRIRRRSRGRFFANESILFRLPFEWISFVVIMLLLALYIFLIEGRSVREVSPEKPPATQPTKKPI